MKFAKKEAELKSALDQWIYALKHASKMKEEPHFLKAPGLAHFFYLAKYANLTLEERTMYRTAEQRQWDNFSILDYAKKEARESGAEEGREEGREEGWKKGREEERLKALAEKKEIAKKLKTKGIDLKIIAETTDFSIDEIIAL